MRIVEISQPGNVTASQRLYQMRQWLDDAGIQPTRVHAVRILKGRVTFSATFDLAADAERFVQAFAD